MIDSAAAASGAGLPGTGGMTREGIADNFDTFLQLLTTQLQNQNPMEPLDTNQFTQQLVQFSSVEQQLKTNEFLQAMMQSTQAGQSTQAVSYIGKTVTSAGTQAEMGAGQASWSYTAASAAPDTTITIKDEAGETVYRQQTSLKSGADQLVWDGTTLNGNVRTEGKFTISIDARDAEGQHVPVTTQVGGKVSGVDLSGTEPVLNVNGTRIPLSQVTAVQDTPA